jgi:hypothetical protein
MNTIADMETQLQGAPDSAEFYIIYSDETADYMRAFPRDPHSYRGYYDELAFDSDLRTGTVGELRALINSFEEEIYPGPKGGEYYMTVSTPLHLAHHGDTGCEFNDIEQTEDGSAYFMRVDEF